MTKRKILVIGANGMLGYAASQYFRRGHNTVAGLTRQEFDIASAPITGLTEFVQGVDAVVNCAGVIKPRIEAMPVADVIRVNSIFPRNLGKICAAAHTKCFHITTDCVYSGANGPYVETDFFDADDIYGMTKSAGEPAECMVLRTSIIGEEKGAKRSLLEWAKSQAGKQVNGFTNHWWNGVTTVYLAEIIETILDHDLYQPGVFHVHSEGVNKFELLKLFDRVYELDLKIRPVEWKTSCDRRLSSIYDLSSHVSTKPLLLQMQEMQAFFSQKKG